MVGMVSRRGISKPRNLRAVDARVVFSNPKLAELADTSGVLPITKKGSKLFRFFPGGKPVVLQPMKSGIVHYPGVGTRDFSRKYGDYELVSKGTGAKHFTVGYGESKMDKQNFSYDDKAEINTHRFWGGYTVRDAKFAAGFSKDLNMAFEAGKKRGFAAWKIAERYGVDKSPTYEVVNITKPRRNVFVVDVSEVSKLMSSHLVSKEEKAALAFEIARNPGAKRIEIGLKNALELMGIPKNVRRNQAVMNYIVKTNKRLYGSKYDARDILLANGLIEKNGQWFSRSGNLVSLNEAKKYAINRFAASVGLGVNLMHKKLKGTFTGKSGKFSSLDVQNVTLAGEIVDLDTCRTNLSRRSREQGQRIDRARVRDAIKVVSRQLWPELMIEEKKEPFGPEIEANRITEQIINAD